MSGLHAMRAAAPARHAFGNVAASLLSFAQREIGDAASKAGDATSVVNLDEMVAAGAGIEATRIAADLITLVWAPYRLPLSMRPEAIKADLDAVGRARSLSTIRREIEEVRGFFLEVAPHEYVPHRSYYEE